MDSLQAVLAIVLIDLTLSGDNALVIGMAARGLPERQRTRAIVVGGVLAVALRVAGTALVTLLLLVPYLQLAGGVVLVVIAYRLVRKGGGERHEVRAATSLREAVGTIVITDAAMSLENVLGVGAAAHGDVPLLIFGLALSIPIVLFGSGLVVRLLERWPGLIWLGAFALVWTAADMILEDPTLARHVPEHWAIELAATAVLLGLVAAAHRLRLASA
jgi:YjbE family integral membrane protein